jgi:hypothetical protein
LPPRAASGYDACMRTDALAARDVAKLIRKAVTVAAYFRGLSGRCHQCHFPAGDPLKIAADDALAAIELYEQRLRAIGATKGVRDPWAAEFRRA